MEDKSYTIGILSYVKRLSTRKKAEEYMSKSTGPGDPLLDDPSAFMFTDGSALPKTALQNGEFTSLSLT